MPYKVYKTGSKWCTHKKNPDGSKGKKLGCHATREEALAQARAVYASEEKKEIAIEEIEVEEIEEKERLEKGYVPWGVSSFAELEDARKAAEAAEKTYDILTDYTGIVSNILSNSEISDKSSAVISVTNELQSMLSKGDKKEEEYKELDEKAVWTTAYKNDLPDSSFLYVTPNCGSKDSDGKTKPRSCRKFPYKDKNGKVDPAHVRNAIARIPQAKGLSADVKKRLQARARKLLGASKAIEEVEAEVLKDIECEECTEEETPIWQKTADAVINWMKEMFYSDDGGDKEQDSQFMIWKEADGGLRWLATYSNKFRDDDRPQPEIISEKSHIRFEHLVDEKQVSMPELWLWHVPEWKFGVADWVAYDTEGFALASGTIDEGKEAVAEWVSKQKDVAVSHGMPVDSIIRDPDDPTIIVGHVTREISPLPYSAAANKRTDFLILSNDNNTKQEEVMSISSEKKKKLLDNWKDAPPNLLEQLEAANAGKAKEAIDDGVEFKETEVEEVEATEATEETEEATSETTEEPSGQAETQPEAEEPEAQVADSDDVPSEFPTREEVVEALSPMAKQIASLEESVAELATVIKELKSSDDEKIAKTVSQSPPASVAAMIARNMSAVGSKEAEVGDEDKDLKDSKPAEAESDGITGFEWIDNILLQEKN